jgi:hypothetical protein
VRDPHQRGHFGAVGGVAQARQIGARRTLGASLRVAGLITGGRPGLALLTEAVAVLEHSPAALERARALTDLGAACRRAGDLISARQILHRACQAAQDLGAAPLVSRAQTDSVPPAAAGAPGATTQARPP